MRRRIYKPNRHTIHQVADPETPEIIHTKSSIHIHANPATLGQQEAVAGKQKHHAPTP